MKRDIHHLTKLRIGFLNGDFIKETDNHWLSGFPVDRKAIWECLDGKRLYEFVKSAPFLEDLDISFHTSSPVHLTDVVDSFRWKSLITLHFQHFQIGVSSLRESFSRHSSTLSRLSLGDLQLQHTSPNLGNVA